MGKDAAARLLGKVVRLVLPRSGPRVLLAGAAAAAEGESDSEHDGGSGRQLLRELMERRRRNDMVRRREFDQLRRMRRLAAASAPASAAADVDSEPPELGGFLDTTIDSNPEERAVTLRKIDEIEEQMSRQWWKTRPPPSADLPGPADLPAAGAPGGRGPRAPGAATTFAPTALHGDTAGLYPTAQPHPALGSGLPSSPAVSPAFSLGAPDLELPDLQMPDLALPDLELPDLALPDAAVSRLIATGPGPLPGPQPALPGFVHDPALEEAAIEFANGDVDAAQASLQALIDATAAADASDVSDAAGPPAGRELWFALLDLYRALGRREAFEASAIAFAERFGHSPPVWISLAADPLPPAASASDFHWRCPALLAAHTVVRLRSDAAAAAAGTWWLDWSGLEGFEDDAVAPLLEAFGAWCATPVQICFEGAERLLEALEARTLAGAADAEADWWRLRMEALRLLGRMDEYEEAALDYCITYEVSPPSWQAPVCDGRAVQGGGLAAAASVDGLLAAGAGSATAVVAAEVAALGGEIGSDVGGALEALDQVLAAQVRSGLPGSQELLVVDCARLVRLDFVAAGSVLGWVASRCGEGLSVEFRNLHRLVGTFFNVTGISEYARVYVRVD